MELTDLFDKKDELLRLFKSDGRWVKIPANSGKCIVCSDLHNDCRTIKFIIDNYFLNRSDTTIIICGDYIDRSPPSMIPYPTATLEYLLLLKLRYPDKIFMLMGNHDLNPSKYVDFGDAEFWDYLSDCDDKMFYSDILESLPLIATTSNNVICIHGVLPEDQSIFDNFDLHSHELKECLWADYTKNKEVVNYPNSFRKKRTRKYFDSSMSAFRSNLLIKGHNPYAPLVMYDRKCVTIQTSRIFAGLCDRHIAIVELGKPVFDANDIELVNIDTLIKNNSLKTIQKKT
ncbi:MAG: metallophosphoesterase [Desulfamplus sp.]|nr:metallophosphoesterase [Desulfamplus sp.]